MSKRTVIKADEELVIKGKLTVEGNVTQIETTEIVNRLESNSLIINSDGENVTAELTLNSNGTEATISFNDGDGEFNFNQPVNFGSGNIVTTGNIEGNYIIANGSALTGLTTSIVAEGSNLYFTTARARESLSVSNSTSSFGNVGYSTSTGVISFTGVTTTEIRGTLGATTATGVTYDSANGIIALASIPNSSLTNSSITVNGYATALGSSVTLDTGDIAENGNLYFTTARANSAMDAYLVGGAGLTYTSGTFAVGAGTGVIVNANDVQVNSAYIRSLVSVTDTGGDGSLSYNSSTGVFTYTGPNQSEANARMDAYLVGGDGIDYANGTIDVDSTVVRTSGAQTIDGQKTFTANIVIQDNGVANAYAILPSNANVTNLGSWENHFNHVFANVLHAERLDLGDADLSDIHATFYAGDATGNILHTNTAEGLTYEHNTTGGYYKVSYADGLQIDGNGSLAVDNTVIRNSGDQGITGNIIITGTLTVDGTINSQNVEDTYVKDTKITLNANAAVDNTVSIDVNRPVAGTSTYIKWDESTDQWKFTNNGSTEYPIPTSTSDLLEGSNLYFTAARVRGNISVTDAGGDGSLSYNNSSGVITYTGPSQSEANARMDAYLVGGVGLTYTAGTFDLDNTSVTAAAYGNAGNVASFTVDAQGRLTNASNVLIDIAASQINDFTLATQNEIDAYVTAGDGIDITAGNVSVDATVVRTSGNVSISGIKTFTGELVMPQNGISPTNNGSIFHDNVDVFAVLNGVAVKLTPQSDVGEVEDVGTTGIDIYAGYREILVGNANIRYHGIKSITNGSYLDISEASNVITVAGNATGIRGLISATGNISYDSANGIISENLTTTDIDEGNNLYFTAARARGNISGTGLISYNSGTGVISTTADNYGNWNVQTDSGAGALHSVTSNSTVIVQGGSGITVTNTGGNITIASTSSADIEAVTAGDGLTGGGISGAVTLNVGAGAGITVNADNIALTSGIITTGAKTYGTASQVAELTVDTYGRVTSAANLSISITASQVSNFTSAANSAIDARVSGGAGLTYSSGVLAVGAGTGITVNADNVAVNMAAFSTTDLAEGSNLYFTAARANAAMDAYLVADGGLTYTSGTFGVGAGYGITVGSSSVSVSNAEVRALFTGSTGVSYNSSTGAFTLSSTTGGAGLTYSSGVLAVGAGAGITVNADNVALTSGVVTAGTYGNASAVSQIVVDTYGRVTSASNVSISISSSQVSGLATSATTDTTNASNITSGTLASARLPDLTVADFSAAAIQTGTELFASSDTVLMTANAVYNKINAIQAGNGLDKILNGDGDATYSVDLTDTTTFTSTNTASRAVVRDASGNFAANVITATATSARYADLAENYQADAEYAPGTVLVFGGAAEVTACVNYESTRVAGVVTTQPAHVMNSGLTGPNVACIALRGRVPVLVKGIARKGDVLVTAGEGHHGYAVASLDPRNVPAASIVGKVISDKLDPGLGTVEALI